MKDNSAEPTIGTMHDEQLGDVLVLHRADLPTLSETKDAAPWLCEHGVPCTRRNLVEARRRGELTPTLIGKTLLYSERDLIAWVKSRKGAKLQSHQAK